MKYEVRPGPEQPPVIVDVSEPNGDEVRAKIGDKEVVANVARAGSQRSYIIDGFVVDPTRTRLRPTVTNERASLGGGRLGAGKQEKIVKSPMPGRIVKINVKPGDAVEPGTSLLVVEAMKMENEVRAKSAGTVADVHVAVGQAVEAGGKLVSFQ